MYTYLALAVVDLAFKVSKFLQNHTEGDTHLLQKQKNGAFI